MKVKKYKDIILKTMYVRCLRIEPTLNILTALITLEVDFNVKIIFDSHIYKESTSSTSTYHKKIPKLVSERLKLKNINFLDHPFLVK